MSFWQTIKSLFVKNNFKISTFSLPHIVDDTATKESLVLEERELGPNISIPARTDELIAGSQFINTIINVLPPLRDQLFLQQCMLGNLPFWMRNFKPIIIQDANNTLIYYVAPDFLCIGNDQDFVRISLGGNAAKKVCDSFGCMLPTKQMSDQIWKVADLKLLPVAMGASYYMGSTTTLLEHNKVIEKKRNNRNFELITGIKKDIVITKSLLLNKTRIAIYGWHYPDTGQAIQGPEPNSTSHSIDYQDYSHGIRLVAQQAFLNGNSVNLYDILNNKSLAYLISHEGAFDARNIYR